jgi:integrase
MRPCRGVFERPKGSGVWWIHYYDNQGKRHREKVGRWSTAVKAYRKRKTEILEGRFIPPAAAPKRVPFASLVDAFLRYSKLHKSPLSYQDDQSHGARIKLWFPETAADVTPAEIDARLRELREAGRSPATVNRYRSLLSAIFSLAVRDGVVAMNPVRGVKRLREPAGRVRYLSTGEEAALRRVIRRNCAARELELDLALNTGIRRGALYRLRWEDVDEVSRTARVVSKGGAYHLPLNAAAMEALRKLRRLPDPLGYVLATRTRGERPRDGRHWFEDAIKEAGIKNFRYHDLRHTFASRLVMAGVDIRTVQALMGHRTIQMTLRYSHLSPAHLREAVEKIAGPTATVTATGQRERTAEQVQHEYA